MSGFWVTERPPGIWNLFLFSLSTFVVSFLHFHLRYIWDLFWCLRIVYRLNLIFFYVAASYCYHLFQNTIHLDCIWNFQVYWSISLDFLFYSISLSIHTPVHGIGFTKCFSFPCCPSFSWQFFLIYFSMWIYNHFV